MAVSAFLQQKVTCPSDARGTMKDYAYLSDYMLCNIRAHTSPKRTATMRLITPDSKGFYYTDGLLREKRNNSIPLGPPVRWHGWRLEALLKPRYVQKSATEMAAKETAVTECAIPDGICRDVRYGSHRNGICSQIHTHKIHKTSLGRLHCHSDGPIMPLLSNGPISQLLTGYNAYNKHARNKFHLVESMFSFFWVFLNVTV